ncbi:hypothetical protein WISP_55517 [Willisornis vidua]|uniref:Uncharacterized protein n=1 Tax=Willisornis vidua TaxID=1566151 RepID=A0ABQ9DHY4_9PASS|nr:hypothetical protein WISP_55517 [Willisornis vidua]
MAAGAMAGLAVKEGLTGDLPTPHPLESLAVVTPSLWPREQGMASGPKLLPGQVATVARAGKEAAQAVHCGPWSGLFKAISEFWDPLYKKDIRKLKPVQTMATKLMKDVEHKSYKECLRELGLSNLKNGGSVFLCQATPSAVIPHPILILRVALTQLQDLALDLVDTQKVPMVQFPLDGILFLRHVSCTTQQGTEVTLNPIIYISDEDIK